MREGIPARVSEIDPTRFWVWVSNSVLTGVPNVAKKSAASHSSHSFASFPAFVRLIPRICAFVRLSRHEKPACPPKRFLAGGRVLSVIDLIVSLFTSTPEDTGPAHTQIMP